MLFGAYLGQSHEVTVFTRREEQAQKIRDMGISLFFQEAGEKVIETDAAIGESGISDQDILIIAVKQYDLSHLMSLLSSIPKEIPL
ncbi:2-dehydropantoate 2-reductase N-terminal domain-containing protein, partial [Staphylococcus epidermidis]|uniref:2-dehydropantoate 2-reductase N-terminal domain-containing protein n=1 Tax=Staphylococcus epidermidis TaxID=1282 RepID=UPI0028CB823F